MIEQHTKITIRNFQWDDLEPLRQFANATTPSEGGDEYLEADEWKHEFEDPSYHPLVNCFVARDAHGRIVGYCDGLLDPDNRRAFGYGMVAPEHRRQGLGTQLVHLADAQILKEAETVLPADAAFYMRRWVPNVNNTGARALLERAGYHVARYFFQMRIALEQPIGEVTLPEGFEVRSFDLERDGEAVYRAQQEAFSDHWGFAPSTFEKWRFSFVEAPYYDPAKWFIAYHGDEVAAFSICTRYADNEPDLGWVWNLGTRRDYRRRGLASALLRYSFSRLQTMGFNRVGLGVDASSPTGAVALYEQAGMHIYNQSVTYLKYLRGTGDL